MFYEQQLAIKMPIAAQIPFASNVECIFCSESNTCYTKKTAEESRKKTYLIVGKIGEFYSLKCI